MKRTLLISVLAVASFGAFASSASARIDNPGPGISLPGPQGPDQYNCVGLGDGAVKCFDLDNGGAVYHCSYSGGAYQCVPASAGATDAGARDLEKALSGAGIGPNSPGLSSAPAPAQGTAGGSQAPTIIGGGYATSDSCAAKGRVSVPETSTPRTLHLDFGDGTSQDFSISPGTGTETMNFTHYYPGGMTWDPSMSDFYSTDDYEVVAAMMDTGAWDATSFRHYTENITP